MTNPPPTAQQADDSSPPGRAHRMAGRFDAVIADVDGCITPERPDPFDADRIADLRRHNDLAYQRRDRPVLTLCTGRPQPFAECLSRAIGNLTLPVIAENGVWLWHPESNAYDRDPRILPAHVHAVHEAIEWVERELGPKGCSIQPGKTCSFAIYHGDHDLLHSLIPRVREGFQAAGWPLRVSATWFYINCDLEFISKATAIQRLMEQTGIPAERLAGVGDTPGDLAIREHVAWFACPANAHADIKPRADHVSEKPEIEGVLDILASLPDEYPQQQIS